MNKIIDITSTVTKQSDFNDKAQADGLDAVKQGIEAAAVPAESDDERAIRLARLSAADYDRCRDTEAKAANIRTSTLDGMVNEAREKIAEDQPPSSITTIPTAFAAAVDLDTLLCEIRSVFQRFVIVPEHAYTTLALWTVQTYCFEWTYHCPILSAVSPDKRCGKSVLLRTTAKLARSSLVAANVSAPALYRAVESYRPTLLIDEWDSQSDGERGEALRNVLNSGHAKDGCVIRCEGDTNELRTFSTYCPKVVAGIGKLPDTVADRSIIIPMRRKLKGEKVERFRRYDGTEIQSKCQRWATDHQAAIESASPKLPNELDDRACDNWEPLLTIADLAGGDWPVAARRAAIALSAPAEADNLRVLLLSDIRDMFQKKKTDRLTTAMVLEALNAIEDRPWATLCKGHELTAYRLSSLLKPYGIAPGTIRIEQSTAKGYQIEAFEDTFIRYLSDNLVESVTPSQSPPIQDETAFSDPSHVTECVGVDSATSSNGINGCDGVTELEGEV